MLTIKPGQKTLAGFALLILAGCAVAQVAQQKTNPYEGRAAIEITTRKDGYFRMEPIWCDVKIKNISPKPINEYKTDLGGREPYTFIVKNVQGETLPSTAFQASAPQRVEAAMKRGVVDGPLNPHLEPGATATARLVVNKYADITDTSRSVSTDLDIQVERFGTLSNTIRVKIFVTDSDIHNREMLREALSGEHDRLARTSPQKSKK